MLNGLTSEFKTTPLSDRMLSFIKKGHFGEQLDQIFKTPQTLNAGIRRISQLHKIRDFYLEQLGTAVMEEFHQELLGKGGQDMFFSGRDELIQPAIEWLRNELILRKENFQYIFRTSRGSTYFVLPTGESLRFKITDPNIAQGLFGPVRREKALTTPYIEIERVTDKCYFIDDNENKKILEETKNGFLDTNIQISQFMIGAIPLELNSAYKHGVGYLSIEADNGILHIGDNVNFYHPGTKIKEIIKK
jgi:hypothetical protein